MDLCLVFNGCKSYEKKPVLPPTEIWHTVAHSGMLWGVNGTPEDTFEDQTYTPLSLGQTTGHRGDAFGLRGQVVSNYRSPISEIAFLAP